MKTRIIDAGFNEDTGISHVIIQTPKGTFTGYSKLQEEDRPYVSKYAGCRYAEIKANIKAVNAEIQEAESQLSAFEKFYNNISESKRFDPESYEARKIRRQIYELQEKVSELVMTKVSMRNTLMTLIENRSREITSFYEHINK